MRFVPNHRSPPGFEIAVTPAAEGVLVAVAGELDVATAAEFEATLLEQLAEGPVRLDMRKLSFMDSTGIRVFDALLRDLPVMGTTLLIDPDLQPAVRQVIALTGMTDALPFDVPAMNALRRNNVNVHGSPDGRPMLFAHGFGCDQNMWRYVWPAFEDDHRIVLFDHVGAGGSDVAAFDRERYASLHGYADDVLEICRELDLRDVVFVGHSVSAMIGVLAATDGARALRRARPRRPVAALHRRRATTSAASREEDIEGLLDSLDANYLGWSSAMAPVIMGNAGPARARRGADQQLLPHRPGDRARTSRA